MCVCHPCLLEMQQTHSRIVLYTEYWHAISYHIVTFTRESQLPANNRGCVEVPVLFIGTHREPGALQADLDLTLRSLLVSVAQSDTSMGTI